MFKTKIESLYALYTIVFCGLQYVRRGAYFYFKNYLVMFLIRKNYINQQPNEH